MNILDRKSAPPHAEIKSLDLPRFNEINLKNGLSLITLDGVSQDVLKIDVVFTASKWTEPKLGVAHFTSAMLEKGTSKMSAYEIADFFEKYGASVEISSGFDFTTISLYSPAKNITEVFPLFIELFTQPSFPENELSILKNLYLQSLQINNEKTSYVAAKIFREQLFGKAHPYGSSIEKEDVINLSNNTLKEFFNKEFAPYRVFITGNVKSSTIDIIASALSAFKEKKSAAENNQITISESVSNSVYIEKQDSIQTSIRLGKKTFNKTHEDYPVLILLNHILGGYFGSRLMKNIREEKGLTYGIYSSISTFKNEAYLVIGTDVNKTNKDLALTEIRKELIELTQNLVNDSEFRIAKNHLLGSLQLELASPFSVIEKIKNIRLNNLPDEFYSTLFERLHSLQPRDLNRVAKNLFEDTFIEVSVG